MELRLGVVPRTGGFQRTAWASVVTATVLGLVASACGSGRTGPPAASSQPAGSRTTAPAGPPALPVVGCPSGYGGPAGLHGATLPAQKVVHLSPGLAGQLSYYSNDTRVLTPVLGPRGWACQVQVGADGTTSVDIHPPGSQAVAGDTSGEAGVNAASDAACQGCVYATVCALVPKAGAELGYSGLPCSALPSGSTVHFLRGSPVASGPLVDDVITYSVPTAPTATEGVLLYRYQPGRGGSASQETCNLPSDQHDVCTGIRNEFISVAWLMPH